jgi:hypothetical protein
MAKVDVNSLLRDAGYTAVGFGILAFQRAQVRRRELERSVRAASSVSEEILRWAVGQERPRD